MLNNHNKKFIIKSTILFIFIILFSTFIMNFIVTNKTHCKKFYEKIEKIDLEFDNSSYCVGFLPYNTYEEAYVAFFNHYNNREFEMTYYIAWGMLNDYDMIFDLSHEERLLTLFQLYDSSLQYLFNFDENIGKTDKINKAYGIFKEIYQFSNFEYEMSIITNDIYMNNIYQMALKYYLQIENLNKTSL